MRLLAVGFDAVGSETAFGEDSPPMFKKLVKTYSHGPLQSTKTAHTGPANTAIYEGIDRSDIFGIGKAMKVIDWTKIENPTIFDILSEANIEMGLMNLPLSNPFKPYKHFVIVHETRTPPDQLHHYPEEVGKYLKNYRGDILNELGKDAYVKLIHKSSEAFRLSKEYAVSKVEVFKTLCAEWDVDFGFIYFDFTDRIAHIIRRTNPVFKPMMLLCGDLLSDLMISLKPEHTLAFSDHGWGFYKEKVGPGLHQPIGLYIYTGQKGSTKKANLVDLAPTILKEFGINKPSYMEGTPL